MKTNAVAIGLLAVLVGPAAAPAPAVADTGHVRVYTGEINGAPYRAEVPARWNGTLLLWSRGAFPEGATLPAEPALANNPLTVRWLTDRGYAVAASQYRTRFGWIVEEALGDQIALLDWFDRTVGTPRKTISRGASIGGLISIVLAERNPRRFDGVLSVCGAPAGTVAHFNAQLDLAYALKTLLFADSDVPIVRPTDPLANEARVQEFIQAAFDSGPQGHARLALANAVADVPGWFFPTQPEPATVADRALAHFIYDSFVHQTAFGRNRVDIERRTGGNPSWNVGVDYRELFARSGHRAATEQAYREAGLDLDADLARLDAGSRISPDPRAVVNAARHGTPFGITPWPVLTLQTRGDGVAPVEQHRWYGDQVRRFGNPANLRQLYVERGMHCTFPASEEIIALRTLLERVETGRWPSTDPARLTAAANALGPDHQLIVDPADGQLRPVQPAFREFTPGPYLRPFPF